MEDKILEWYNNKKINPYTGRTIKENGPTYNRLNRMYFRFIKDKQKNDNLNTIKIIENNIEPINSIEDIDVISLNNIWKIVDNKRILVYNDPDNLITYKDEKGHIHSFEKESIQYLKEYKITEHPLTKIKIPQDVFDSVNIQIKRKRKTDNDLITGITSQLTHYSFFLNNEDINELNILQLNKLYYEIYSFYNENMPDNLKSQIFAKKIFNINPYQFDKDYGNNEKKRFILETLYNFLNFDNDLVKINACYIIISGLTIISKRIKLKYPDFILNF